MKLACQLVLWCKFSLIICIAIPGSVKQVIDNIFGPHTMCVLLFNFNLFVIRVATKGKKEKEGRKPLHKTLPFPTALFSLLLQLCVATKITLIPLTKRKIEYKCL